jgi:mxaJ protein
VIAMLLAAALAGVTPSRALNVCADPNNLPYSNSAGTGLENKIAAIVADELGAELHYTWWAQRRGALRNTLFAHVCDLVPGMASASGVVATTTPYYRSSYVFVVRANSTIDDLTSIDDARLRKLRIGVQLIGDEGGNTPPAQALARRGIVTNVRGYMVYGDYRDKTPQSAIVDAVADGTLDVAIVWGPTAGYFAARAPIALTLNPVAPGPTGTPDPMAFDISMGVRRNDDALKQQVNAALARRHAEIEAVLDSFHVPRLNANVPLACCVDRGKH